MVSRHARDKHTQHQTGLLSLRFLQGVQVLSLLTWAFSVQMHNAVSASLATVLLSGPD